MESMNSAKSLHKSTLLVTGVTAFMAPFMLSSINVALPDIQREFGVNAVLLGWIATAYLLATAVILVPAGRFADIYGRKKVFVTGVIVYTLGSLGAVFVPGIELFIASRVVQGAGAAMFMTTGMAILTAVFPPQQRGRALGILVTAVYAGLATGPFAGGIMTQLFGWRSLFVFMVLLGGGSVYITLRFLTGEWAEAGEEKFDLKSALLYGAAVFCFVYGGTRMPALPAAGLLLAGCLGLAVFFLLQKRITSPLFDVRLFENNRTFLFSSLAALIHYAATFAITFQMSLFLQYLKGMSPQGAGTLLMIQPLMMALFSARAGHLSDRIEPRIIASAGMALTTLGLIVLIFLSGETPLWLIALVLALLGFGFALFSSPNMSAIMGAVERRHYGLASGTVATMRLFGQMISMTVATVFLAVFVGREQIQAATYPQFQAAMQYCFAFFVILAAAGIAFSLFRGNLRE
jgi:MFS family permease